MVHDTPIPLGASKEEVNKYFKNNNKASTELYSNFYSLETEKLLYPNFVKIYSDRDTLYT